MLGVFAHRDAGVGRQFDGRRKSAVAFYATVIAAAAVVVALVGVTLRNLPEAPATLDVARLSGEAAINRRPVDEQGRLPVGGWLVTGERGRAAVDVASIGRVEVGPNSRLSLLRTSPGDHEVRLAHGSMEAVIWAPPGQFSVKTPSSTAVDLGCIYGMTMAADGTGIVEVSAGWVGFKYRGREAFIPAGAACVTRPGRGPGTPHYVDAPAALRESLAVIDSGAGSREARARALDTVLTTSRSRDALTLWHLLTRVDEADRDRVFDRLSGVAPPPPNVTREGIRAGDRRMLDDWWNALNLGTSEWWTLWTQEWRDPGSAK
jgi:hypothetical protein